MTKSNEIWIPVKGYEGYYFVSNLGQIMKIFAASATAKYPTASVVVETNASSDSTE